MADFVGIEVRGLDILVRNLDGFTDAISEYLTAAGKEAGNEIINTQGLRKYPPNGPKPAFPWVSEKQRRFVMAAIRDGRIEVPYRRGQSPGSERYGTQFVIEQVEPFTTKISNRASYAPLLAGEQQSGYMARLGWRKLSDVAEEKRDDVARIYNGWTKKLIRDKGLE